MSKRKPRKKGKPMKMILSKQNKRKENPKEKVGRCEKAVKMVNKLFQI